MDNIPPGPSLDEHTRLLIKTLAKQLKLTYPYLSLIQSSEIQGNGIFSQAIKTFISVYLPKCDVGAKHVICGWLKLDPSDLPEPLEAIRRMQHDHIIEELAARGLIDFIIQEYTLITDSLVLQRLPYEDQLPQFTLQGNNQQLLLITGPPILHPVLNLSFAVDLIKGFCVHDIQIKSFSPGDNLFDICIPFASCSIN